jgi:hypothetical protein
VNKMNKQRADALGEPISTANSKLKKILLYEALQRLGEDFCYRCDRQIDNIEDLSIEHTKSWLYAENPKEVFFDTSGIAFSHRVCNSSAKKIFKGGISPLTGRISPRRKEGPEGTAWCHRCKTNRPIQEFTVDNSRWNNLRADCSSCRSEYRKNKEVS